MRHAVVIIRPHLRLPPGVRAASAPSFVGVDRVVAAMILLILEPGIEPPPRVICAIIVPEIIVAIPRTDEQAGRQKIGLNYDGWGIDITRLSPERGRDIRRRKEHPTPVEIPVPKSIDIDRAARRIDVVCRRPDPVGPGLHPVPRPPGVVGIDPDPATGSPDRVRRWRRTGGADFQAFRGLGKIGDFFGFGRCPESRSPAPAIGNGSPVTRNPTAYGGGTRQMPLIQMKSERSPSHCQ